MSRTISYDSVTVKLPKNASKLSEKHKHALEQLFSDKGGRLRKGKACPVIFFHSKGGKPTAVQRCEGRTLKATNRRQCRRGGKGPNAHRFVRCSTKRR